MEVIQIGSEVILPDDQRGYVVAFMVEGKAHYLSYRVAYWNGSKLEQDWISGDLVKIPGVKAKLTQVGFSPGAA